MKPENSFITGVHRYLPPGLHKEKMHNPYRGGTFDMWYSGLKDLWVEYKFVVLPKRDTTPIEIELSPLQKSWGLDRAKEGRNVAVIVGCKEGGVVMTIDEALQPIDRKRFVARLQERREVAQWLVNRTQGAP